MTAISTFVLHGEIESSRPLRAVHGKVAITGWCLVSGSATAPPIRLVTPTAILPMTARIARADLAPLLPAEPAAAHCGFTIAGRLSAGVHIAHFEAQTPDGEWRAFKQLTLVVEAVPFGAVIDEPVSDGILRDRVKVGGWALDPAAPVKALWLCYGHRRIPCVPGQPRSDVGAAFPEIAHASRAGFVSEDFLVAGHGSVRVRAVLSDGRTVMASTNVTFSIDRDENHEPELQLTAARIPLAASRRSREPAPPRVTDRPRNILFILPGSFASNSALHVAALADELVAAGHAVAVAVAHDKATLAHLDRPTFRGLTHMEAEDDPAFPDKRGPDVVHAWTTRENVRLLAEKLRSRHAARTIVHLEDNEQQILALTLDRTVEEIALLSDVTLDAVMPADLSHPRRSKEFLDWCDGVTVIMDRLREFVPTGKPCTTLMPAADARSFFPRPIPTRFRATLGLAPGTTILAYHGNVHSANAAEMRELYAAVLELNLTGHPVILLRTGLDRVDFLGEQSGPVAPFVLSLGLVPHHRHLGPLLALADIFVQPGVPGTFNDYRFPSKLPEFFAIGRPVILPRTNLGTTLRHGIDAYVLDRADATGIIRAVRELRNNPTLALKLAQGALAFGTEHFSWRRSAETLATFYSALTPL